MSSNHLVQKRRSYRQRRQANGYACKSCGEQRINEGKRHQKKVRQRKPYCSYLCKTGIFAPVHKLSGSQHVGHRVAKIKKRVFVKAVKVKCYRQAKRNYDPKDNPMAVILYY